MSFERPDDDALAYLAITRLQAAYADVVTRRAWAELDGLFLPDAPVHVDTVTNPVIELVGPQALGRFIDGAIERFEFFEFVPLNTVVDLYPDHDTSKARGRLYICELRQARDGHRWTTAYGLYRDTYRKADGQWRFARRDYSSLARGAPADGTMDVFPIPGDAP